MTDAGLPQLARRCPMLTWLHLSEAHQLTAGGLASALGLLPCLAHLDLTAASSEQLADERRAALLAGSSGMGAITSANVQLPQGGSSPTGSPFKRCCCWPLKMVYKWAAHLAHPIKRYMGNWAAESKRRQEALGCVLKGPRQQDGVAAALQMRTEGPMQKGKGYSRCKLRGWKAVKAQAREGLLLAGRGQQACALRPHHL